MYLWFTAFRDKDSQDSRCNFGSHLSWTALPVFPFVREKVYTTHIQLFYVHFYSVVPVVYTFPTLFCSLPC